MLSHVILLFCAALGANGRSLGKYANVIRSETAANNTYDFIIAGGGIAGLTVADRLTEDPNVSVLVVEYGPFDQGEDNVLIPGAYPPFEYLFPNTFSTPQPGLNNQTFLALMGGVVGGGSIVNAMFFHRASVEDYAAWAALGANGWDWNGLLPYFKKSENFTAPNPTWAKTHNISYEASVHGTSGPVHASYSIFDYESSANFWNAALNVGIHTNPDPNAGDLTGLFWLLRALNPDSQTRSDARIDHYDRVINSRPNYHVLPSHLVSRVLFEGTQAIGVEYLNETTQAVTTVYAKKEVIIAAGAVHSPQILQLSGVGPKPLLDSFRIKTVVDLPGVGQNFQDQLSLAVDYTFTNNYFPNAGSLDANATYDAEQLALYRASRQGAYTLIRTTGNNFISLPLTNTTTPSTYQSIISLAKSEDPASLLPPNTHPTVLAGYIAQRKLILAEYASLKTSVGSISWSTGPETTIYTLKPLSRGTVNINSTNPLVTPLIDFRSLSDPVDLEVTLALVLKNREIVASPSMQVLGPTEVSPGQNITDPEVLKSVLRGLIQPSNGHLCCTNAMMDLELGGVVDSELLVYGTQGLSVVDISRFPLTPATAPSATVYAAAEKAADIIKLRHGIPLS